MCSICMHVIDTCTKGVIVYLLFLCRPSFRNCPKGAWGGGGGRGKESEHDTQGVKMLARFLGEVGGMLLQEIFIFFESLRVLLVHSQATPGLAISFSNQAISM